MLLITLILLEFSAYFLWSPLVGKDFDKAALQQEYSERLAQLEQKLHPAAEQANTLYQFHPYVGYTGRPGAHPWGEERPAFNTYGLLSLPAHPYPYKKQGDEFVVAILGGSVADIFANLGEKYVQKHLREAFGIEKQIVLLNLATGGYKQPQQLFQLQFALLSGFEIDAVLNLDGFNDLVLAEHNQKAGVNALYPSNYHLGLMSKLSSVPDPDTFQAMADYYQLFRQEASVLNSLSKGLLRHSALASLVGEIWLKRQHQQIASTEYQLSAQAQRSLDSSFQGPPNQIQSREEIIKVWQQASRLIYQIAKAQGWTYVHALQPNQYVEDSKPLTAHEQQVAYNLQHPWSQIAQEGYAALQQGGAELAAEGLPFYDVTDVFADNHENLYTDDCCHFGERGNEILAERLVEILLMESKRQQPQLPQLPPERGEN